MPGILSVRLSASLPFFLMLFLLAKILTRFLLICIKPYHWKTKPLKQEFQEDIGSPHDGILKEANKALVMAFKSKYSLRQT